MKAIAEILKEHGMKVTPQRLAIYSMLQNSYSHPTAEDIYNEVVLTNPSISLATVYKTLDSFSKAGLVHELHFVNEHSNYDAHMEDSHSHLICTCCNKIYDYKSELFPNLASSVSTDSGFDINKSHFTFYGTCPECKAKA